MLRLPDPVLLVLVGPSASGKSHWAAGNAARDQVVSSDRLRAVVGEGERDLAASVDAFAVLQSIVAMRVRRRLTTVVDTLGSDAGNRRRWRELAAEHGVPCVAVAFATDPAECRRRNAARAPHERVPRAVLDAQLRDFARTRPLLDDEGFDRVLEPDPVRVVPAVMAVPASATESTENTETTEIPREGMRFGLHLSRWDLPGGPPRLGPELARIGAEAERAGFDSIWVMDHFRQIPQVGRAWEDMPESTATLGHLAAVTERIGIGCLVNGVTYRNVAHLGRIVATLDVLSGGRARCGLGAGWFAAEHEAYGWPFPPAAERLDLLEDALKLLPVLWGPGSKPFTGRRIQVPETLCYPRPVQARIPILVGGQGERRTLKLAAEYADACNLTGDADTVRRKVAVLHGHCAAAGRDPAEVEVTHLSTALVGRDRAELDDEVTRRRPSRNVARWSAWHHPGTVDDHVARVRDLAAAGVQHVIVSLSGVWDSPAVERYGEVIAAVR